MKSSILKWSVDRTLFFTLYGIDHPIFYLFAQSSWHYFHSFNLVMTTLEFFILRVLHLNTKISYNHLTQHCYLREHEGRFLSQYSIYKWGGLFNMRHSVHFYALWGKASAFLLGNISLVLPSKPKTQEKVFKCQISSQKV